MTRRQKLITAVVCLSAILCTLVTGAIALLVAETDSVENTFTPSNIAVKLEEAGAVDNKQSFQMIPGKPINKEVKVTVENNVDCYVFVEVTEVNNAGNYLAYAVDSGLKELTKDGTTTVYYKKVTANDDNKIIYVLKDSSSKFDLGATEPVEYKWKENQVLVRPDVTKAMMDALYKDGKHITDLPTLTFKASAIQSDYLAYPADDENATDQQKADAKALVAWETLKANPNPPAAG